MPQAALNDVKSDLREAHADLTDIRNDLNEIRKDLRLLIWMSLYVAAMSTILFFNVWFF